MKDAADSEPISFVQIAGSAITTDYAHGNEGASSPVAASFYGHFLLDITTHFLPAHTLVPSIAQACTLTSSVQTGPTTSRRPRRASGTTGCALSPTPKSVSCVVCVFMTEAGGLTMGHFLRRPSPPVDKFRVCHQIYFATSGRGPWPDDLKPTTTSRVFARDILSTRRRMGCPPPLPSISTLAPPILHHICDSCLTRTPSPMINANAPGRHPPVLARLCVPRAVWFTGRTTGPQPITVAWCPARI